MMLTLITDRLKREQKSDMAEAVKFTKMERLLTDITKKEMHMALPS